MASGRRGLFFSIDSIMAIVASAALIFATMSVLSRMDSQASSKSPSQLSEGIMASFELSGVFENSVSNSSIISSKMYSLAPPALCWEMKVIRYPDGQALSSAKKAGCSCGQESTFSRRALAFRNATAQVHAIAEGRFCYR